MNDKELIESILKILTQEARKIKPKKKNKFLNIVSLNSPTSSLVYMDAVVSEALNEGVAIKPVTKKFDHLKWSLNMQQKQFLDDFVNIPEISLKESDYNYASKLTGIPVVNIKSICNTYCEKQILPTSEDFRKKHEEIVGKTLIDVNQQFTDIRNVVPGNDGKIWSSNPNPEFRGKSFKELEYNSRMGKIGGKLNRSGYRQLPKYIYEWLMYFIEGSDCLNLNNSYVLDEIFSTKNDNIKYVSFSINIPMIENKVSSYDLMSNKQLFELNEFKKMLNQFNESFKTNFDIEHQFVDKNGALKVIVENYQIIVNGQIQNMKKIDMSQTDEYRFEEFEKFRNTFDL